jgi:hypothetical protein
MTDLWFSSEQVEKHSPSRIIEDKQISRCTKFSFFASNDCCHTALTVLIANPNLTLRRNFFSVDVTEEFVLPVTKMSPYYDS